jgi:hypothetical protein
MSLSKVYLKKRTEETPGHPIRYHTHLWIDMYKCVRLELNTKFQLQQLLNATTSQADA